jgi:hypothetical protein
LTEAAAVIGPPVRYRLAASSLKVKGGKSPTLLLAGLASPFSHTTTLDIDIPDQCGADAQFLDHLLARLDDRHPGRKGHARAAAVLAVLAEKKQRRRLPKPRNSSAFGNRRSQITAKNTGKQRPETANRRAHL